jgi:hypothetical protein
LKIIFTALNCLNNNINIKKQMEIQGIVGLAKNCITEQFSHVSEFIDFAGSSERCEGSPITKVQMDVTGRGVWIYLPEFISGVSISSQDMMTWDTTEKEDNTISLSMVTMAKQI